MNKRPTAFMLVCIFLSQPLGLSALGDEDEGSWDTTLSESEVSERSFIVYAQEYEAENDDVTELSEDCPDELLMREIENGSLEQRYLRGLISEGADIHKYGDEPLRYAARLGKVLIVRMLLHSGANIHALQGEVLREAISSNQRDVVEEILDWSKREEIGYFSASLVYELYKNLMDVEDNTDDNFPQTEIRILLEVYLDLLRENLSYIENQLINEITCQEINQVVRLVGHHANVHACGGLSLTIAVLKKDAALVELLLEYAQPSRQGLFPLQIITNCIKLVKEQAAESDKIFNLLQSYLQEYWDNVVSISHFEMLEAILDNDPLLLNRWLTSGADIHYAHDELLSSAVNLRYHRIVDILLSWSLGKDQIIYHLARIETLIEAAEDDVVLVSMLEKYERKCRVLMHPER